MPTAAFDEIFADVPPALAGIGKRLEQAILAVHPAAVAVPYPGYKSVNYGFGTRKNAEAYAYLMPQKDRVNLGFYRGAHLADPRDLLEGSGADLRHVKVRDETAAGSEAIAQLIRAGVEERRDALGVPTRRASDGTGEKMIGQE